MKKLLLPYLYFYLAILLGAPEDTRAKASRRNAVEDIAKYKNKNGNGKIIPTWEELDARPLPTWYDDAKFGIFIHWGVFSVPSFNGEWLWYNWKSSNDVDTMDYIERTERYHHFTYQEYAARFQAELYQPHEWAQVFAQSGAQYVVLTSKHHDGYCNWNSKNVTTTWNWNAMDIGPNRDLLGDLAKEVKHVISPHTNLPLKFGIYHSLYEWYNPMYLNDKFNNYTTQQFVTTKTIPELYDLVEQYEPELIWSDGDWEAHSDYWQAREFLSWYTNQSTVASTAVYNDRWGSDVLCQHGSFLTCSDRYSPDHKQSKKYENAFTIDLSSWGFNRNTHNNVSSYYLTTQEIIHTIIKVVAFNGNVLLNIGPHADGTIDPIFLDRLQNIGKWLSINGEAIYGTRPWAVCQNETISSVFYTTKQQRNNEKRLYAIFTKWPTKNMLQLSCVVPTAATKIYLLGLGDDDDDSPTSPKASLQYHSMKSVLYHESTLGTARSNERRGRRVANQDPDVDESDHRRTVTKNDDDDDVDCNAGIEVVLPALTPDIIPCQHAWVLVLSHVENVYATTGKVFF